MTDDKRKTIVFSRQDLLNKKLITQFLVQNQIDFLPMLNVSQDYEAKIKISNPSSKNRSTSSNKDGSKIKAVHEKNSSNKTSNTMQENPHRINNYSATDTGDLANSHQALDRKLKRILEPREVQEHTLPHNILRRKSLNSQNRKSNKAAFGTISPTISQVGASSNIYDEEGAIRSNKRSFNSNINNNDVNHTLIVNNKSLNYKEGTHAMNINDKKSVNKQSSSLEIENFRATDNFQISGSHNLLMKIIEVCNDPKTSVDYARKNEVIPTDQKSMSTKNYVTLGAHECSHQNNPFISNSQEYQQEYEKDFLESEEISNSSRLFLYNEKLVRDSLNLQTLQDKSDNFSLDTFIPQQRSKKIIESVYQEAELRHLSLPSTNDKDALPANHKLLKENVHLGANRKLDGNIGADPNLMQNKSLKLYLEDQFLGGEHSLKNIGEPKDVESKNSLNQLGKENTSMYSLDLNIKSKKLRDLMIQKQILLKDESHQEDDTKSTMISLNQSKEKGLCSLQTSLNEILEDRNIKKYELQCSDTFNFEESLSHMKGSSQQVLSKKESISNSFGELAAYNSNSSFKGHKFVEKDNNSKACFDDNRKDFTTKTNYFTRKHVQKIIKNSLAADGARNENLKNDSGLFYTEELKFDVNESNNNNNNLREELMHRKSKEMERVKEKSAVIPYRSSRFAAISKLQEMQNQSKI